MTTQLESKIDELREIILRNAPPQLMTTREAAAYLQVSEMQLHVLRKKGNGPKFLQPTERTVRYRLSDIEAWLARE